MTTALKRLIRPLIPDRLMARYRLEQHSRHSRVNVDVLVEDRRQARRWLATTPDTYRVRLVLPRRQDAPDVIEVKDEKFGVGDEVVERASGLLSVPEISAVIAADTKGPRLADRRRAEPVIGPRLVVTTQDILNEVGGVPYGAHPLPGLVARLRDAGHHLGLIPLPPGDAPTIRTDPIESHPIVVLSAVPMHDIGGGSRSAQLALEFVKQGFHVAYVSMYEAQESVDLGLRFIHPNLEQYGIRQFDAPNHHSRAREPGMVLVEAPAPSLIAPAMALQESGWEVIYDVIDDWSDPALGGDWYSARAEGDLIERADRLIASATDLVERINRFGRTAKLVPNAVNADVFGVDLPPRPLDLPEADLILGYHGSLYGDWFDWEALQDVAEAFPDAAVVVIGDNKAPHPEMPSNVHFLGLKSQRELPAYIQRFDVGLLPFKVNDTTHAVSPLKVYEYLASGVPVAAPPLRALESLGISNSMPITKAIEECLSAESPVRASELAKHSWTNRVREIIPSDAGLADVPPISVVVRAPKHYGRNRVS